MKRVLIHQRSPRKITHTIYRSGSMEPSQGSLHSWTGIILALTALKVHPAPPPSAPPSRDHPPEPKSRIKVLVCGSVVVNSGHAFIISWGRGSKSQPPIFIQTNLKETLENVFGKCFVCDSGTKKVIDIQLGL